MPWGAAAKGPPAARSRSGRAHPAPAATPCPPDSGTARTEISGLLRRPHERSRQGSRPPSGRPRTEGPAAFGNRPDRIARERPPPPPGFAGGNQGGKRFAPGHTRRSRFAISRRKMPQEPPRGFRSGEIGLSVIRLTACSFPAVRASAPRRPRFPRHRASRAGGERRPCVTGSTGRRRRDGRKSRRPLPPHICPPGGIGCTGRPAAQTGVRPGGGRKDGA